MPAVITPDQWDKILMQPVREIPFEREGTGFDAQSYSRDAIKKFLVMLKDEQTLQGILSVRRLTSSQVCFAKGVPRPYSFFISDDGRVYDTDMWCWRIHAMQPDKDDWQRWIVTCNYSNAIGDKRATFGDVQSGQGSNNRPDLEPPTIDWDFEVVQKARARDLDGKAFLNSARQPFTPTPTFEEAYPILTFTRNEMDFNRARASEYAFAVNEDVFLGAHPGQAQCLPPKATQMSKGKILYWKVTWRIRFLEGYDVLFNIPIPEYGPIVPILRPKDWQPEFLDAGLMELQPTIDKQMTIPVPGAGGAHVPIPIVKPVPIHRGMGRVSQPYCLDGKGRAQEPNKYTGEIYPVWLKFRVYQKKRFADLMLQGL